MNLIKRLWHSFTRAFTGWLGVGLAALLGVILGVGLFTFFYAGIGDYLQNDPASCKNCHVMNKEYDGWLKSSHHTVATCNDCHVPHDNVVHKYAVKAEDGVLHAAKFTFGNYPENIRIRDKNRKVTESTCIYCHGDFTDQITNGSHQNGETLSCTRCHSEVGHKR